MSATSRMVIGRGVPNGGYLRGRAKTQVALRNGPRSTWQTPGATIARRLGTLRMFFVRIGGWGWDEAPPKVPMFPGDLPRLDQPLPRGLDDAAAAKLLRAA